MVKSFRLEFEAIGTSWMIDVVNPPHGVKRSALLQKILRRIGAFDKNYSRFRDDSLVRQMSRRIGVYNLPSDGQVMFDLYRDLYLLTDGLVTPLIGNLMEQAGYGSDYRFEVQKLSKPISWDEGLRYSFPELEIKKEVLLDVGALGKGYLVDLIGDLLAEVGIENFCVDAGGDILYRSINDKITIGLEHPRLFNQIIGEAELVNNSICGSSGNRRKWGGFHHIINPVALKSVTEIEAVWVIAKTAVLADGLATALFFVELERFKQYDFEYVVVYADLSARISKNFPGKLY